MSQQRSTSVLVTAARAYDHSTSKMEPSGHLTLETRLGWTNPSKKPRCKTQLGVTRDNPFHPLTLDLVRIQSNHKATLERFDWTRAVLLPPVALSFPKAHRFPVPEQKLGTDTLRKPHLY